MVNTHDVSFRALLDTGASCRILRRNIFEQLIGQTHQICHILKTRRMQAVNVTEIQAIGNVNTARSGSTTNKGYYRITT